MMLKNIIFFALLFWAGCSASSDYHLSVNEGKLSEKQNQTKESSSSSNLEKEILNINYRIAEKALIKAINENDKEILRVGLKSQNIVIKKKAADALRDTGLKDSVPDLIEALEHNKIRMQGGTEARLFQRDLDKAIITTLEKLTQIDFDVCDPPSPEDINIIIDQSNKWWDDYNKRKPEAEF